MLDERKGPQPDQFSWYPDCSGKSIVIIASGPSANQVPLAFLKERDDIYVIAINESWKLFPWCDMLYGCDAQWWYKRKNDWLKYKGLKVTQDRTVGEILMDQDIKRVFSVRGAERLMFDQPGYIGWFGNSGTQAINLAAHFKPSRIILVGFDMSIDKGLHWHGSHSYGLHNPKIQHIHRWRRCTDNAYHALSRMGVGCFNTSMDSALTVWPKMSLEDALECPLPSLVS